VKVTTSSLEKVIAGLQEVVRENRNLRWRAEQAEKDRDSWERSAKTWRDANYRLQAKIKELKAAERKGKEEK